MKTLIHNTKLAILLGALVAVTACGDDDNGGTVDARPSGTVDAPPAGAADARPADAAVARTFNVTLTKEAERPSACTMAGASAMGSGTVTLSADESMITVNVTYSGLSAAASAAHIHCGAATTSGGVALGFTSAASPIMQTFTSGSYTPGMMCPATFPEFVTMMKAGNTYVNVHTAAPNCPNGEIRGQITP